MRRSTTLIFLFLILSGSLILRICCIGTLPGGLFCDEAATGYDAYSVARTGKDMWGHRFPLFFNHHGVDRVEPIATYLTVPFVALFGMNATAIRLPAALAGTLTVLLLFFFMRRRYGDGPALWAALFLALSPWHLPFSRVAFRGILVPLFTVAILWAWERSGWTIPFAGLLGLALYTYTPYWVFLPLLLFALVLLRPKRPAGFPLIAGSLLFLLLAFGVIIHLAAPGGMARASQISVFSHPHALSTAVTNLLDHLSYRFLITNGDPNGRHGTPGWGLLHPFELFGILIFLYLWIRGRRREDLMWPLLFLFGILPAVLTVSGIPNALRAIAVLPAPQIMAALGLAGVSRRRWVQSLLVVLFLLVSLFPLRATFILAPLHPGGVNAEGERVDNWWQAGLKDAVDTVMQDRTRGETVYLSPSINQAYIFPLVFVPIAPEKFQETRSIAPFVALPGRDLEETWSGSRNALFIVKPGELPRAPLLDRIPFVSGETAYRIVTSPVREGAGGRDREILPP